MTTLVINTSQPEAELLLEHGDTVVVRHWKATPQLGAELLANLDELLIESEQQLENIERIAVHTGPGHFSALRTGSTVGTMLATALGTQLIPVSGSDEATLLRQASENEAAADIHLNYVN